MVGWHHRLNGHEFEQALGDGEGQGSLACYRPWGHKEWDTTEQRNNKSSNNIASHKHAASSSPVPLLVGTWVASTSWLL